MRSGALPPPGTERGARFRTAGPTREILGGLTVGLLGAIAYVSYAALIFTGSLAPHVAVGIGLALLSGIVLRLVCLLADMSPGSIVGPASAATAISAVVASSIASGMAGAPSDTVLVTVIAALAALALLGGTAFLFLARSRPTSRTRSSVDFWLAPAGCWSRARPG